MTIDPAFDPLKERLQRAVAPDYRVEHRIGEGGMGVVYRAHQGRLNRGVAIKVLRPELYTADGAEAFLREAQTLADVKHPNVIVIHDTGDNEGLQYYIMEFVNGPTLERRLDAGPIPPSEVTQIGADLLRGLEAMHRAGFVHRDIKPSNVFVLSDGAKLGDFGIARPPSDDEQDSHNRDCTPEYGAPEQVEGRLITPRTDIYSTGVILYEAVTGRPFHEQRKQVDWSRVPNKLARVLQRAGTLASWRLARLLDGTGQAERGDACDAYATVVRQWSDAPSPYGARADTARTRAGQLNCPARMAR